MKMETNIKYSEIVSAKKFIETFFSLVLRRKSGMNESQELENAISKYIDDPSAMLRELASSEQIVRLLGVPTSHPPGHFYSPVVDPSTVGDYVLQERKTSYEKIAGLNIDVEKMRSIWVRHLDFIRTTPFGLDPTDGNRFFSRDGPYPMGDAIILRMMIQHFKPKRIIEIGSGRSTACILDSLEHIGLTSTRLICIDPFADRMKSLLHPSDFERIDLLENPVQETPAGVVENLESGDILFIDSTHVLKTGSDVHYEFFHLLPRVAPGVVVHFHDIMYPFEYPDLWIHEVKYSWNEIYALRAFLMYNSDFKVIFWNTLFARQYAKKIREEYPGLFPNPGTGIWIERIARTQ